MEIIRATTEQIVLHNLKGDKFELFRQVGKPHCFVTQDSINDDIEIKSETTSGIVSSYHSKPLKVDGKFNFEIYFENEKTRDDFLSFIYRNLDFIKVERIKLDPTIKLNKGYAYCSVDKDSIGRLKQSNRHKGIVEFNRHTEWLVEETIEGIDLDEEPEYFDKFDLQFDFRFSDFETNASKQFFGGNSPGHIEPYIVIKMYGPAVNPKITLQQDNNTQIVEFENTYLNENDILVVDNRMGLPQIFGRKHLLNGRDYFGHTKTINNKTYLPEEVEPVEQDEGNYVTFLTPTDLNFIVRVENVANSVLQPTHRFVRW